MKLKKRKYFKSSTLIHYLIVGVLCFTLGTVAAQASEEEIECCGTVVERPLPMSTQDFAFLQMCLNYSDCALVPWHKIIKSGRIIKTEPYRSVGVDISKWTEIVKLPTKIAYGHQDGRLAFDAEAAFKIIKKLNPEKRTENCEIPKYVGPIIFSSGFPTIYKKEYPVDTETKKRMMKSESAVSGKPVDLDWMMMMMKMMNHLYCELWKKTYEIAAFEEILRKSGWLKKIESGSLQYESRLHEDFNHSIVYQSNLIGQVVLASDSLQTINDWSGVWKDLKTSKLYRSISADMDSINPKQNYWQSKNFQLVRGLY